MITHGSYGSMLKKIDRTSPKPYYEQLAEILRDEIESGAISTGEPLPSESVLGRRFGLSRATVRQGLRRSAELGWVTLVKGRGAFASKPRDPSGWVLQDTSGFLEDAISHRNDAVTTEVLSAKWDQPLPDTVREALSLPAGARGLILERRRRLGASVALFSTNFLPEQVAAAIRDAKDVFSGRGSLNAALRTAGYRVKEAKRVVRAVGAPARIAQLLSVRQRTALLRISSTSWDADGVAFDSYETWVRSDVIPLEIHAASIGAPAEANGHHSVEPS